MHYVALSLTPLHYVALKGVDWYVWAINLGKGHKMTDWRSKPRTGKAQFVKHLAVIQTRLDAGETQNSIRQLLAQEQGLEMSAAQFSRYLKAFNLTARFPVVQPLRTVRNEPKAEIGSEPKAEVAKAPVAATEPVTKAVHQEKSPAPKQPLTQADFRKIRENAAKLDLNALIEGYGVIYTEK
jgi:hypothetical protein